MNQTMGYRSLDHCDSKENIEVQYRYEFNRILPDSTATIEEQVLAIGDYIEKVLFRLSFLSGSCDNKAAFIQYLKELNEVREYSKFDLYRIIDKDSIRSLDFNEIYLRIEQAFKGFDKDDNWNSWGGHTVGWYIPLKWKYHLNYKTYHRLVKDTSIVDDPRFINLDVKFQSRQEYLEVFDRLRNADKVYVAVNLPTCGPVLFQEVFFNPIFTKKQF